MCPHSEKFPRMADKYVANTVAHSFGGGFVEPVGIKKKGSGERTGVRNPRRRR